MESQVTEKSPTAPAPSPETGAGSDPETGVQYRENKEASQKPAQHHADGAFDGSFAGTLRNRSEVYTMPWYKRREYFLSGWTDAAIWRAATVEMMATAGQMYLSGQFAVTIMNYKTVQIAAYVGIYNTLLLAVFIYATAPASGGHMNPLITWATMLCGLCPLSRGVVYIAFQTIGGALAGGLLLGSWGEARAVAHMGGGCFFDIAEVSRGQVLLTEIVCSMVMVILAYGTGLDPRQAQVFGPQLGPLLVGIALGIVSTATTGMAQGYTGAAVNPARCFALSVARGGFEDHWIWWVGPAVGGLIAAILYNTAPPYHAVREKSG